MGLRLLRELAEPAKTGQNSASASNWNQGIYFKTGLGILSFRRVAYVDVLLDR